MVREHFDESFERMREQSNRLADVDRTVENFDEIVEERAELDRLRHDVTEARKDIVSRFEPPAPDLVQQPLGKQDTRTFGKIAAAVSIGLLVACGFGAYRIVQMFGDQFPLHVDTVAETFDTSTACHWDVDLVVRNESETAVQIDLIKVVANREFVRGTVEGFNPTIPAGESAPMSVRFWLGPRAECPADADDIEHGNIIFELDNGETVSTGL